VRLVRQVTLDASSNQDLPFDRLVQEINPLRDASRMPLFQVKFVLQNAKIYDLDLPGLELEPIAIETSSGKYDLLLTFEDTPSLAGALEFNTDLFDAATVKRRIEQYLTLLQEVVASPDCAVIRLIDMVAGKSGDLSTGTRPEARRAAVQRLLDIQRASEEIDR
jgi:non-ribosomal peptide synthetase component F